MAVLIFLSVRSSTTGPWESSTDRGWPAGLSHLLVAARSGPITTSMGMSVNPTFADAPKPDVLAAGAAWIPARRRGAHRVGAGERRTRRSFSRCATGRSSSPGRDTRRARGDDVRGFDRGPAGGAQTKVVRDKRFVGGKIVTAAALPPGSTARCTSSRSSTGRGGAGRGRRPEYDWRPDRAGPARTGPSHRTRVRRPAAVPADGRTRARASAGTCWDIRRRRTPPTSGRLTRRLSGKGRSKWSGIAGSAGKSLAFSRRRGRGVDRDDAHRESQGREGLRVTVTVARVTPPETRGTLRP